ncbi:phage tail tape measure protein, partial [Actinoplanes teichomyceticus]
MARTVTVKIGADTADFRGKLREAGRAVRDFRGEMERAARGGHLDSIADSAARMGVAGVGAFGVVIASSAKFQKAMSGVSAATHASARDMQMLRDAALEAGKATSYSATDAAAAETELAKAGVSVRDIINGGLSGALSLAAAGQMDVAEAAETAASALTQFKLKGSDVPHIADLLAAGAGKAQGSVHDLGAALNQAGLVSAQMGLSVEDTTGTLAAFASAGLMGSDAGTSLKTAMLMLANPTDKARSLMEELGIQVYDASGKFVGVTKLAGSLKSQLGTLTQEQRNSALATIFGSDAIRAASVLYEQGASGIQTWIDKVDDQGYAADTAARQTDNLIGDIERLKGSLETMAIESGSGANGGLRMLAQGANAVVDRFAELPPAVGETITIMAGLTGALMLGGAGWVKMRRSNAEALAELRATGPAGAKAAAGLQRAAGAAGKAAGAFALLQIADMAIAANMSDLNPQVDALTVGLGQYAQTGKATGEMARLLGGDLGKLDGQFQLLANTDSARAKWAVGLQGGLESVSSALAKSDSSLSTTRERVTALDQSLAQMVQGGQTDAAKRAFAELAHQLAVNGVSMDEFKKQFPQYAAALQVSNSATADATTKTGELGGALQSGAGDQKEYATATDASAAAVRGQRDALDDLSKQLRAEADPVFGLLEAQDKLAAAQDAVAKATKEHGKKSSEAKQATRDLAVAALDLQGKVGALGGTFKGQMTPELRATLRAAGLSEKQIKNLAGQFREAKKDGDKFSKNYRAEVQLTGYSAAAGQMDKLLVYQHALRKGIPVSAAQSAYDKNSRKEFHA